MRVDVDKIADEVARARKQRELEKPAPILVDHIREARVLVELACEPELLVEYPDLELDDFNDFRHRKLFMTMRRLQASLGPLTSDELLDAIEELDVLVYLGTAVVTYHAALGERGMRECTAYLRSLAETRRQL